MTAGEAGAPLSPDDIALLDAVAHSVWAENRPRFIDALPATEAAVATGEAHVGNEAPAQLNRGAGGHAEETFFNFVYRPLATNWDSPPAS